MITRIMISGIQEASVYHYMATVARGQNDNDYKNNSNTGFKIYQGKCEEELTLKRSFVPEERWLLKQRTRTKWS